MYILYSIFFFLIAERLIWNRITWIMTIKDLDSLKSISEFLLKYRHRKAGTVGCISTMKGSTGHNRSGWLITPSQQQAVWICCRFNRLNLTPQVDDRFKRDYQRRSSASSSRRSSDEGVERDRLRRQDGATDWCVTGGGDQTSCARQDAGCMFYPQHEQQGCRCRRTSVRRVNKAAHRPN